MDTFFQEEIHDLWLYMVHGDNTFIIHLNTHWWYQIWLKYDEIWWKIEKIRKIQSFDTYLYKICIFIQSTWSTLLWCRKSHIKRPIWSKNIEKRIWSHLPHHTSHQKIIIYVMTRNLNHVLQLCTYNRMKYCMVILRGKTWRGHTYYYGPIYVQCMCKHI